MILTQQLADPKSIGGSSPVLVYGEVEWQSYDGSAGNSIIRT
jgi:hypothetical protein